MKHLSLARAVTIGAAFALFGVSQQAAAEGTDAGTVIGNTVTVDYQVNGLAQDTLSEDAPTFVVDRIVTFTVEEADGARTNVTPNESGAATVFTITNTSNAPLDFSLVASDLAVGTDVDGDATEFQASPFTIVVDNTATGGTATDDFVDNLAEGASITVTVLADIPVTAIDGQLAGLSLTATPRDAGTNATAANAGSLSPTVLTTDTTNTVDGIETVLDTANIQDTDVDGYFVTAANLAITKDATVISDPINGTTDPFAIPGAVIEYAIVLTNSGAQDAENISISDTLTPELLFETADLPSGSGNVSITVGATTTYCTADVGDATVADGCTFDGTDELTIAGSDSSGGTVPLTVSAGDTVTIRFRATIDPS